MSFPSSPQTNHPAHQLRIKLEEQMYRGDEKSKRFITCERIEKLWPEKFDDLRELLGLQDDWTDDHLHRLEPHFKRVCILAWIRDTEFHHHLHQLKQLQPKRKNSSTPLIDDDDPPLSLADCSKLFGETTGHDFYRDQFMFAAITISADPEKIQTELPESRWPFISDPELIGSGGFGEVAKVRIVKRHLREGNMSSSRDQDIAVKQFREERAWLKEVSSLEVLKGSLSSHDHLVLHLAAIIREPELSIFLPYTRFGDLETYFQEGYLARDTSTAPSREYYNFSESFPKARLKNMLCEFAKITDAIDFLHNRVSSKAGPRVFCAHVDLRPQNVLVFPADENHPAGFWKISDFGISSFRLEDGESVPEPGRGEHPSIGDVVEKRWNPSGTTSTALPALRGAHRAPELALARYPHGPRASDLWSLACILSELIVFGTGAEDVPKHRKNRLSEFRKQRESYQSDLGFTNDSFFDRRYDETPGGVLLTISIRAKVNEWLLDRVIGDGKQWQGIVAITRQMLHPNPSKRVYASEICKQILKYCEDGHAPRATAIPRGREPIWQIYVCRADNQNDTFVGDIEDEDNIQQQSTPDPPGRQDTIGSVGSMEVSRPDHVYPHSLKVTKTRSYRSWCNNSEIVESAPSGKTAAYLTSSTSNSHPCQVKFQATSDLKIQDDKSSIQSGRTVPLPDQVKWTQISVGEDRAIVRGTSLSNTFKGQTAICAVDIRAGKEKDFPVERSCMRSLTHICASGDVVAAGSDESVWLWTFEGEPVECQGLQKPSVALVDIAMSNHAQFLFCWWTDVTSNLIQIWNIADKTKPQLAAKVPVKKAGGRSDTRFILPCENLPACIIYDGRGTVATAVVSDVADGSCKAMLQPEAMELALPESAALCATSNHLLSYIDAHGVLYVHRLILEEEDSLAIEAKPLLKYTDVTIDDVQCISLEQLDGQSRDYSLKIYNARGDVQDLTLGVT